MFRTVTLATCAVALVALSGCQSKEEKEAERQALKDEIRSAVVNDLNGMVANQVSIQLQQAIDDHKRKVQEEMAKAQAEKTKPKVTAPPAKGPASKKH